MTELKKPLLPSKRRWPQSSPTRQGPCAVETSPLAQAFGRTLAKDIIALRTQPPKALSAMDGYALRAADAARAASKSSANPPPGAAFAGRLRPGRSGAHFHRRARARRGRHRADSGRRAPRRRSASPRPRRSRPAAIVAVAGIDFHEGAIILRAGRRLSPADIALAAAADHPTLPVARPPRVARARHRRRTGRCPASARPRPDRRVQCLTRARPRRGGGRRGDRSRHLPPTGSTRSKPRLPRPRRCRRCARHHRRRLGRRPRSGARRAGRARAWS